MNTEKLKVLALAYRRLNELMDKEKALRSAIAEAERAVMKELGSLPPGTVVPLDVPELSRTFRFSAGVTRVWNAPDWEQVYQYIRDTGNCAVLQKRLASPVVAELHERGEAPWAVPFDKPTLVVRTTAYVAD